MHLLQGAAVLYALFLAVLLKWARPGVLGMGASLVRLACACLAGTRRCADKRMRWRVPGAAHGFSKMIRNPTLPQIPLCLQVLGVALGLGYSYLFHANRRRKQLLSDFVRTIQYAVAVSPHCRSYLVMGRHWKAVSCADAQ